MAIMTSLMAAAPELTNWIGKFMNVLYEGIENFGWTAVVFTIIVKVILSPLDVWQKVSMRKQAQRMKKMQPSMDKLQKQYANRPDILKQKQAEMMRGQQKAMLMSCLPMIITMITFFIVFSGFNAMITWRNEVIVYEIAEEYNARAEGENPMTKAELAERYEPEGWLWVKNVFMPDNWSDVIPDSEKFIDNGLGGIGGTMPDNFNFAGGYNTLISPAMEKHNKTGFWNLSNWNGYMLLPVISVALSLLSIKLSNKQNQAASVNQAQMQKSNKIMMIIMPIVFGLFSIFYSAAFSIYLVFSSIISTITSLIFNMVYKKKDEKELNDKLTHTYKR